MPNIIKPGNYEEIKKENRHGRFGYLTETEKRQLDSKQFAVGRKKGGIPGQYEIIENGKVVGLTNNIAEAERVRHLEEQN